MQRRQSAHDDPRRGVWCRTGSLRTAATPVLSALTRARLCLLVASAAAVVLCPGPGLARAAAVVEYEVPSRDALRIAAGSDGAMWFTEPSNQLMGRISTSTGAIREFGGISDSAGLWDMTLGPDGAIWFLERDVSQVGRITTAGTVTEYPLPADATLPGGIAAGRTGTSGSTPTRSFA